MNLHYEIDSELHSVNVESEGDSYRVTLGDRTYEVRAGRPEHGRLHLTIDGRRCRAYVAGDGNTRYIAVHGMAGRVYTLERVESRRKRRAGGGAPKGSLDAQMPGQIVAVLVDEGQTVEAGQPLVLIEAMKMELRVTAPAAGVVTTIHCREGDVVERGQRLVEVETNE